MISSHAMNGWVQARGKTTCIQRERGAFNAVDQTSMTAMTTTIQPISSVTHVLNTCAQRTADCTRANQTDFDTTLKESMLTNKIRINIGAKLTHQGIPRKHYSFVSTTRISYPNLLRGRRTKKHNLWQNRKGGSLPIDLY